MTRWRPRPWMYEAPLFYLALWALQRGVFPASPGFASWNPSPLWLGVLLFGLRYGVAAGSYAGALAALVYAAGVRAGGEGFRFDDADFYVLPGLFVVLGAALGGVAERFNRQLDALRAAGDDLAGRNRGLLDQIQAQKKAMRAVEHQVVSQMSSVVTLYHGSRELGTLDRDALMPAMLDFFKKALEATKAGLYVPKDGRWTLLAARGWERPDEFPTELAAGEGLIGRAAAEGGVVTLKASLAELESGRPAAADALMAASILDPSGKPAAVFAVNAMPFLRYNSAAVNLLALLAEWGAESLAKCVEVEGLRARSLLDEELSVHSARYLEVRLAQEFSRARRFALPLSLVLLRVDGASSVPAERWPALLGAIAHALRATMRDIDILARSPFPEAHLALLLPTTTRERAEEARDKALKALATLELPGTARLGVCSYAARMTSVDDLVGDAKRSLA